jgi:hypothetical protein
VCVSPGIRRQGYGRRVRFAAVPALALALVLAGCGSGAVSIVTVTTTVAQPGASLGAEDARYFGRIVSLRKVDTRRYLLVLRPEFFLVGVAANVAFAASQHQQCPPLSCPGVADDRWVVPAGNEHLIFVLPAATRGTVLTVGGGEMHTTPVTAAQLAALEGGAKKPRLIEPLDSGVWLRVRVATVTAFAQQFQP